MSAYFEDNVFDILKKLDYRSTCSLLNPREKSISFLKDKSFIQLANLVETDILLLTPKELVNKINNKNIKVLPSLEPISELFIKIHNKINANNDPIPNVISVKADISKYSEIGIDGNRVINTKDNLILRMKHMGNVVIEDGVRVESFSTIHRASLDSTIIRSNSTICSGVNIGHNCKIGHRVFIAPGVKVAGSVEIGDDCKIWQGSLIRNGIKICSGVEIGMGSVVTKNINTPGLYYGSPCKMIREL